MKKLIILYFLINLTVGNAQENNEIFINLDKDYPGIVSRDTLTPNKTTYRIQYHNVKYIDLEPINSIGRVEKKSFVCKANVITVFKILNLGIIETMKLFENKKVFIIESRKNSKRKIVLREVNVKSGFYEI